MPECRILHCWLIAVLLAITVSPARCYTVSGSTVAAYNLLIPAQQDIERSTGESLEIIPNGSAHGLVDLVQGRTDATLIAEPLMITNQQASPIKSELADTTTLHQYEIGGVRTAFIVNDANPLVRLSLATLTAIFQRKLTHWNELGGTDQPIFIVTLSEHEREAMQSVVEETVMGGSKLPEDANTLEATSGAAAIQLVAQHINALGFCPRHLITNQQHVRVLTMDINLVQHFSLVIRNAPTPRLQKLIDALRDAATKRLGPIMPSTG